MSVRADSNRRARSRLAVVLSGMAWVLGAQAASGADNAPPFRTISAQTFSPLGPGAFDPGVLVLPDLPPGFHPETTSPPPAPVTAGITLRETHRIDLAWRDRASLEDGYKILRRDPRGGPWQQIAVLPPQNDMASYSDTTVQPDSGYCYMPVPFNVYGSSAGPERCTYTRRGLSAYRAVLVLRTSTISDADTDDDVSVRLNAVPTALNSISYVPAGNVTWLDYGRDDFERGTEYRYDLELSGIQDLGDIVLLHVSKEGSDAWCLSGLTLEVNGVAVFEPNFGNQTCRWIGSGTNALSIFHDAIRAHPLWASYTAPPTPLVITNAELESRIEGTIGHALHGMDAYWGEMYGARFVESSKKDDSTLAFDLDLAVDVSGFDPELDIDFDLRFAVQCVSANQVELTIDADNLRIDTDFNFITEALGYLVLPCGPIASIFEGDFELSCVDHLENLIGDRVRSSFKLIARQLSFQTDICEPNTPILTVATNGDVQFGIVSNSGQVGGSYGGTLHVDPAVLTLESVKSGSSTGGTRVGTVTIAPTRATISDTLSVQKSLEPAETTIERVRR